LAVAEVVKNSHLMPCVDELNAGMGANVTCTTRNKNHEENFKKINYS
jgi:hypothetical protein